MLVGHRSVWRDGRRHRPYPALFSEFASATIEKSKRVSRAEEPSTERSEALDLTLGEVRFDPDGGALIEEAAKCFGLLLGLHLQSLPINEAVVERGVA